MSEWKECKLGDVADFKNGKARPSIVEKGNIPIYGGNGILGYTDASNWHGHTVIIGRVGAYCGSVYFEDKPVWVSDNALYSIPKTNTDAKFLFYLLRHLDLNTQAEGSSHPLLTQTLLNSIDITLPNSLPVQRAIAGVLSSLDEKIDLLHRQNKTLEGMAMALWRKMFIEEAYPGWPKGKLGDIADNVKNGVSTKNLRDHMYYVGLEHIERKHLALYNWGNSQDVESNKSKFERGDILYGKLRAYFHKVCFAPVEGICSTDILVIRPKQPDYFSFCLMWFFSEDVVNYSDASSGGTRMPRTNWETLAGYEIAIPHDDILTGFNQRVKPLIDKIEQNIFSIRTLSSMRDTLLPKLMSGEMRVKI
jgi:type I restriction enzyme, S subunit